MQITIQNNKSPANELNGRYYQTFTPKTPQELIKIHHMGCIGNTELKNIQLEKGNTPTAFVEPKITQMETSGILNDLRALNLMLTDVNSDLWGRIKANNKGMLTEFFDSNVKSAIATSANNIMQQINSTLNGDYSSFAQRLDALRSTVKNEAVSSTVTQLADTYDRKIATANENVVSRVNQSINNVTTSVQELERGVVKRSDISVTSDGLSFGSSKVIDGQTLSSILNVTPNMMTAITKQMKVTGDMLVNGSITSDKISANSITAGHLASGSISASKLDVDDAFFDTLVAKDSFFTKMQAKKAFIHAVQAIDIKATQLSADFLSAYKGHIGGFQIGEIVSKGRYGYERHYGGKYITGDNQFKIGMSNGDTGSPGRAALWVNWGTDWDTFPENGWVVTNDGTMYANHGASFKGQVSMNGTLYIEPDGGLMYKGKSLGDLLKGKLPMDNITEISRKEDANGPFVGFTSPYGNVFTRAQAWSDRKLKSNIATSTVDALASINKLNIYEYDFKKDSTEYHKNIGLIAQEIGQYLPDAHDKIDGIETYNPFFFVPYLVKAIQQLSVKLEELERKLQHE
jgi:hypothetical protein